MKKLTLLGLAVFLPAVASAQVTDVDSVFDLVSGWINTLVPIIIALAVLAFIWGVFRYVVASSDDDKAKGRNMMIWGVVGIFVMVSVWGLVGVLKNTFGLDNSAIDTPELPTN
ncbi:MAG: pilin [Patescibacteria group bacterium]